MPHPGACFWFAMCLAGWYSGRLNCLPKPCMCWQANSCLVICSLVCTNSGCLQSLLKAACFFLLIKKNHGQSFCPACQARVPAAPSHFPATLIAGLPQPWPCGTQVSEVLPGDTMVTADVRLWVRVLWTSQHQAQDRSTFFDHIDSMCQMIRQWNRSCEFVLLDNPKCISVCEFQHSSFYFGYLGGKKMKQKQAFGERLVLIALVFFLNASILAV